MAPKALPLPDGSLANIKDFYA
ncbi:hypothetical protein CCACVL1_24176 [Corchorus capsularis]|uniref:Uncharacterized protein n=1 Tax=Corchorus capsularis TaxID=210143 RepID=A0A1R3GQM5_COCAP|nr:hypothetical protein CCACVL1_24176 [Corchorus capsularis]